MVEASTMIRERNAIDWRESPIGSHHHLSFRCKDPAQTREYYEDFLGLEFCAALPSEVDADGTRVEALHMLFRMANGDFLGFYHIPSDDNSKGFELGPLDMHLAMKVPSKPEWEVWVKRLTDAGVKFEGPIDHDFVKSVYFQDPNGVWLEFAYEAEDHEDQLRDLEAHAKDAMRGWTIQTAETKKKAREG